MVTINDKYYNNPIWNYKEFHKTIKHQKFVKGACVQVIFPNKKIASGIIERANSLYADIKINNKIYLINNRFEVISK